MFELLLIRSRAFLSTEDTDEGTKPSWMTKAVIKQLRSRDQLLKVAKRSGDRASSGGVNRGM